MKDKIVSKGKGTIMQVTAELGVSVLETCSG